ncbi:hypothetical protein K432DRAFT_441062 [Lepidopterella palustris CBS 459.81]|uniref:Uncharacterized protein n=1 Tax=Lepidopterella palustris CBS 459.81 TaxID=1314670 RepID=A0A8E2EGJ6_9PEZI|nr:hypothetical protein K432DRAFT_441062 [Lepidopterella palustris CBS 459.81]
MPTQQDLYEKEFSYPLYEAAIEGGRVKEKNIPPDQVQRPVITDRAHGNRYIISVHLLTCVHGYLDPTRTKPASLMIFEYRLVCAEEKHNFTSVKTSLEFTEDTRSSADTKTLVRPHVLSFAPFERKVCWNEARVEIEVGSSAGAEVGVDASLATAKITLEGDKRKRGEKRYFTEGLAWTRKSRVEGQENYPEVWWYLRQNAWAQDGIPPDFRVAILLGRSSDFPFQANFYIEVNGCLGFRISESLDRFLKRSDIRDDPINFRPDAKPLGNLTGINRDHLGELMEGHRLKALAQVWGLDVIKESDN